MACGMARGGVRTKGWSDVAITSTYERGTRIPSNAYGLTDNAEACQQGRQRGWS